VPRTAGDIARSNRRWIWGSIGVIALLIATWIIVAIFSQPSDPYQVAGPPPSTYAPSSEAAAEPTDPPTDAPPQTFVPGDTARINQKGDGMPCFRSREYMDDFMKAASVHDEEGGQEIVNRSVILHQGDEVRAIDAAGMLDSELKVRMESGDDLGAACWLPTDAGFFKDIAQS
jgi:hypothetical protein